MNKTIEFTEKELKLIKDILFNMACVQINEGDQVSEVLDLLEKVKKAEVSE